MMSEGLCDSSESNITRCQGHRETIFVTSLIQIAKRKLQCMVYLVAESMGLDIDPLSLQRILQ